MKKKLLMLLVCGISTTLLPQELLSPATQFKERLAIPEPIQQLNIARRIQQFKQALNHLKDCALRKATCTKAEIAGIVFTIYVLVMAMIAFPYARVEKNLEKLEII